MFTTSKPKIRTKTVAVPVKKAVAEKASSTAGPPSSRYSLTPAAKTRTPSSSSLQSQPERPSLSVSHAQQRKRKVTPNTTPQWASSDESSDDGDSDRLGSGLRKRQKTSSSIEPIALNRCLEPDYDRRIRLVEASNDDGTETHDQLIHGLSMSRGDWAKDFKPAFSSASPDESSIVVKLQYPSPSQPEKFETVIPHDPSNFNPLDDIYFSIEEIIQHYLPPDLSTTLASETTGPVRLLKRAVSKNAPQDFLAALHAFNTLVTSNLASGTIAQTLDSKHAIPLSLTRRILAQVYQRTVSPLAHLLKKVKGKETTYGELLPPFVHSIFHQTRLASRSVFVDLGSGVGNVVLQAALQAGAESWGIEVLDRPAQFAAQQAAELRARARLWNLSLGPVHLLHGDFLESGAIDKVLCRADVVLVNNKVFPQSLNGNLLNKFLDLKKGCRVVSLASFGAGTKQKGARNEQSIAGLFEEERFESGTNSVSWAAESVEYYIATKAR